MDPAFAMPHRIDPRSDQCAAHAATANSKSAAKVRKDAKLPPCPCPGCRTAYNMQKLSARKILRLVERGPFFNKFALRNAARRMNGLPGA